MDKSCRASMLPAAPPFREVRLFSCAALAQSEEAVPEARDKDDEARDESKGSERGSSSVRLSYSMDS